TCLPQCHTPEIIITLDPQAGVALAHRRLSVLDLSPAGHQPMCSPCGRYVLVYNGEIYNHRDLRGGLEAERAAFNWRGHSDTETLLAALRYWGVPGTLARLNGMFAFALWDDADRRLYLARDRMGEKPLYYGRSGDAFLFGSELKALTAYPGWRGEVDREALALYLRYSHVPAPWSIYRGIEKLPPAHYVVISDSGRAVSEPQCYWDLASVAQCGMAEAGGEAGDLTDALDDLLRDAIGRRMVADVPLGAFLSGGYDSSTVAALMQAQSPKPVRTFSIGFHETGYDEAKHARSVAGHLGTDHTELYVTPEEARAVIPQLPEIFDEPFADSSQIPMFLVSRLARNHVTVSLSGDGGDELFAGYNRHVVGPRLWQQLGGLSPGLRRGLGSAISGAVRLTGNSRRWLGTGTGIPQLGHKLDKLASGLRADDAQAFHRDLLSHWKRPEVVVRGVREPMLPIDRLGGMPQLPGVCERMLYRDMATYLPDDILTKVDRASMAVSLEARVPLLDHRLVEFAWRVPVGFKVRDGQGKWLLRQVLYRYVPRELMDRPKMGFAVPIEHWLRGPLRAWAEPLLDEQRIQQEGFLDPAPIRQMWAEYLSGQSRHQGALWNVLMFQAWLRTWS
ncbi:MAG: asparagine synthase (glutamine-hydrolyzing), partial [Pseudohongiellaceae bacterium]